MQMNYLDIITQKGFKLAEQLSDEERIDLELALESILKDMTTISEDEHHLFCLAPNYENYQITITDDFVECVSMLFKNQTRKSQREFLLSRSQDGTLVFSRTEALNDGLLITRHPITGPNKDSMYVYGYGRKYRNLMDDFMAINLLAISYETMLNTISEKEVVVPDIQRQVTLKKENGISSINEQDLIPESAIVMPAVVLGNYDRLPAYTALESYYRARNYEQELKVLEGLSLSLEEQIAKSLK